MSDFDFNVMANIAYFVLLLSFLMRDILWLRTFSLPATSIIMPYYLLQTEGRHLYFAHPGGLTQNRAGLAQGIDLRGDGGYIVAPPSIHPSGRLYGWVPGRMPDEITLAPLPRWLIIPIRGASQAIPARIVHVPMADGDEPKYQGVHVRGESRKFCRLGS